MSDKPSTTLGRQIRRVAIVYRMDHSGGVQSCVLSLIGGLNQMGVVPEILWDLEPDWELLGRSGLKATFRRIRFRVGSRRVDRLPLSLRYLAKMANVVNGEQFRGDYDFFYVFYNGFLLKPETPHIRYLSGPPLLPQLSEAPDGAQGIPFRFFKWLYRVFLRRISPVYEYHRECPYVINSQFTAGLFKEAHGVDLPVVTPPIKLEGRQFDLEDLEWRDTVTFFARVIPYKRPELFLDLAEGIPDWRCLLMGAVAKNREAYFEGLKYEAHERGLEHVAFVPNASSERVSAELARTRFYIFPGINEHFGMATAEAIASGAVPFVHDSGGQREIVPDERLRFTDDTLHQKFAALLELSDEELNEIRVRLAQHVRQYSEEVFIQKMLTYLEVPPRVPSNGKRAASAYQRVIARR